MPKPRPLPRVVASGFTLIEVLVVLTISAILLAVGVPMFNSSIASARASDAANSLKGAIELAASTASGRLGFPVTACRVVDPTLPRPPCDPAAVGTYVANDWAAGWVVFAESDAAGAIGVLDPADQILQIQQAFVAAGPNHPEILSTVGVIAVISFSPQGDRIGGGNNTFSVVYPQALAGPVQSRRNLTFTLKGQVAVTRP